MESVEARSNLNDWETPEFEEIGLSAEVSAYVARWDD